MKANILIVEDESIVAQDLQFILEDLGYAVVGIANTGESAIAKVAKYHPDLILMDIRIIGEMDGIQTAKIVVERYDVPVIYLTAHADEETLARAKVTPPYGYIIKPFVETELHTTIEIALYKYQQEQQLKKNVSWLQTVLNCINDGVITADCDGDITFLNPAAESLTCLSFDRVLGKKASQVFVLTDAQNRSIIKNPLEKVLKTKDVFHLPPNTLLIKEDGEEIYINGSVSPIINYANNLKTDSSESDLTGTVMVFQDVTEKKLAAENLHRRAFYDSLTNLPNRDWFVERLTSAIEQVKRKSDYSFAVLFLDLDNFKKINDGLGHQTGDRLLTAVARRIERLLRSIDTVARLGGDEFGIILEGLTNTSEACKVAQRIQEELSKSFVIDRKKISTDCSIGIVVSSDGETELDYYIRNADIAMYRAKEKGKGCYEIFDEIMHEEVITSFQLENELQNAISQNQLVVHYQPIVSLSNQEISGFEALVRWNHPEQGLLYPDKFIPRAEEIGIITQIDLWVLKQVCEQIATWKRQDLYLSATVSVNLSSKHFVHSDFVEQITNILKTHNIKPNRIKLEITETTLIDNTEGAKDLFAQLKKVGFTLSLDDFGKGYSSLSYLQKFPLDVLKIDRCFVRELNHNLKNATITRALIKIAHQLGLTVVAEGVETEAEIAFLSENSCDNIQGYYFSAPLAIQELEKFELPVVFPEC